MGSALPNVALTAQEESQIDAAYLRLRYSLIQLRSTGSDDRNILREAGQVAIDDDLLSSFGRPATKDCRTSEDLTTPVISGDVAFVSHSYHCGELCGRGTSYGLLRRRGKWVIFLAEGAWVS
jgi:hypothetical protein